MLPIPSSSIECDGEEREQEDPTHHDQDLDLTPKRKRSHKRTVKTGVEVFIPHDFLKSPKVVQSLVRNNISSTAISAVMHTIIESFGGETEKLSLSFKTMQRYSAEVLEIVNEQNREDWVPPFIANIYWDGKQMETL